MAMLGNFRARLVRETGYRTDDQMVTPTVMNDAINSALQLIGDEAEWPWLLAKATLNTVAGTEAYPLTTLAADFMTIERVTDANGYPLEERDVYDLEEIYGIDQGVPSYWSISEDNLIFRSIPNAVAAYTVYYKRIEKTLSADTDTPYLPARFDGAVTCLAAVECHEAGERPERASAALSRYEKVWRPRLAKSMERDRTTTSVRVRPGGAF